MPELIVLLFVVIIVLWLWSLIHCIQNKRLTDNNRLIAVLLIVFLGIFGSFIYIFMAKGDRQASARGRGRSGRLAPRSPAVGRTSGRPLPKKKIIFPPRDATGDSESNV
ncbi:MAG TPA: PLDc N-terminal domain-containing protein [Planctomycetota bacterium]|jgi:hypothetical protein|nr:PLDc N-terminal domain-containing protein [Planctomycetota bacterium]